MLCHGVVYVSLLESSGPSWSLLARMPTLLTRIRFVEICPFCEDKNID